MANITQTGPQSWRVLVRRKGHRPLCRTFKSEAEAEKWGRETEAGILAGTPVDSGLTVGACIREFRALREARRPIKHGSTEHVMLRHLEDGIGSVPVDRLTPHRLAEWCRDRAEDGAGPVTVGMEVSKLATVLRYASIRLNAVLPDVVGAARPLLKYSGLIGQGKPRTRRPTVDELERILEHLDPTMQDVVRFAVATGMRRGEVCRIKWADVDRDRRLVLVRDRKHPTKKEGNHQLVPLISKTGFDAWAILNRQPKIDARIFPLPLEGVSDAFAEACEAAGVEDLHLHDMRHECTSRLFEAGMSIDQVAMVTGHADWRGLKRYANLKPESLTAPDTDPRTPQRRGSRQSARPRPDTSVPSASRPKRGSAKS